MKRIEHDLNFLLQDESWDTSRDFCLVLRNPSPLFGHNYSKYDLTCSASVPALCANQPDSVCANEFSKAAADSSLNTINNFFW